MFHLKAKGICVEYILVATNNRYATCSIIDIFQHLENDHRAPKSAIQFYDLFYLIFYGILCILIQLMWVFLFQSNNEFVE